MEEDSVKHDDILDFAIYYCLHDGSYPDGRTKEKRTDYLGQTCSYNKNGNIFKLFTMELMLYGCMTAYTTALPQAQNSK